MKSIEKSVLLTTSFYLGIFQSFVAFAFGYTQIGLEHSTTLLYFGIFPGLPFLILSYLGKSIKSSGNTTILFTLCGLLLVTLLVYVGFYLSAQFIHGANIGGGLLILASPIVYLLVGATAWAIGENYYDRHLYDR